MATTNINIRTNSEVKTQAQDVLSKLGLEGGVNEFYRIVRENGFALLEIIKGHLVVLETLPFHHRDPFVRLLAATAIAEDLTLLTADERLGTYAGENLRIALT